MAERAVCFCVMHDHVYTSGVQRLYHALGCLSRSNLSRILKLFGEDTQVKRDRFITERERERDYNALASQQV